MIYRIVSFSIKPRRTEEQRLISWFKNHSIAIGPDFSSLCIAALKHYKETVLSTQQVGATNEEK